MPRPINRSFGSGEVPDPVESNTSKKTKAANLFKLIRFSGETIGRVAYEICKQRTLDVTFSSESELAAGKAMLAFDIVKGADSKKINKDKAYIESQRQSVLRGKIITLNEKKGTLDGRESGLKLLMIEKQIARLEQEIAVSKAEKNYFNADDDKKQECQTKCAEEQKKLEAMPTGDPIRHPKKLANKWLQAAEKENKPENTFEILDVLIKCGIGNKKEHEDKIAEAVLKLKKQLAENPSPQRKVVILESLINRLQNDPSSSHHVSIWQKQLDEVKANLPH